MLISSNLTLKQIEINILNNIWIKIGIIIKNFVITNVHSSIYVFYLPAIGKWSIDLLHPYIAYWLLWKKVHFNHPLCNIKQYGWDSDCITQVKLHDPVLPQLSAFLED